MYLPISRSISALALTLRVARAMDGRGADEHEDLFARLAVPVGKYWMRTPAHAWRERRDGGLHDASPVRLPHGRAHLKRPINTARNPCGSEAISLKKGFLFFYSAASVSPAGTVSSESPMPP